jgi:hypothetical protein
VLHPPPEAANHAFDSLEVGMIMEHALSSWHAFMDIDLCHNTDNLFTRVKDQEDSLLAQADLANNQHLDKIAKEVLH